MRAILIIITCLPFVFLAHAQPESSEPDSEWGRTISRTLEHEGQSYAWSVMIPEQAEVGGPAILFLHGAGECGTDGKKNLEAGLPWHVRNETENWPFVIIVPQKPSVESEWEDHEQALKAMLDEANEEGLFDPARLAITGLSQGGHGAIMIASMHPERFQAAVPICGYVDRRISSDGQRLREVPATPEDKSVIDAAAKLASMPVWLFHGSLDDIVPPEESRSLYEALKSIDAPVQFTEYPDANHLSWPAAYSDPKLGAWFVEQTNPE